LKATAAALSTLNELERSLRVLEQFSEFGSSLLVEEEQSLSKLGGT